MRKLMLIAFILSIASQVWAQPSVQQIGKGAKIDWTNNVYIATGEGSVPSAKEEPNRGRAYLKAKGYARMAAIANLLMAIKGTAITCEATGKDFMANEKITQRIEGFVNNVQVANVSKETYEGSTIIVVEVRAPMYGDNTPGAVFLGADPEEIGLPAAKPVKVIRKAAKVGKTAPEPVAGPNVASAVASEPGKPYTSLIIDSTGCKIDRCMSPKIRKLDGDEVWGTVKADYDFVQDHGIVAYATSLKEAKANSRCGANPLVIHAIGRAGGKFYSDPVISDADAELLLDENGKAGFLDRFCVIFVKDGDL